MTNLIGIEEITEDDLSYEEEQALKDIDNNNGILSSKFVAYKDMPDETLEMLFDYSKENIELLLKHRPDFIKRCHPEVIT